MNLIDKAKIENLAAGRKFNLEDIPLRKFYEQAQYIEKTLLPAIEKKSGAKSADYEFFTSVYKSLLYAIMIVDRDKHIIMKWQHCNQLNSFLQQRVDLAERELLKYTTMEDLYITGALDHIAAGVAQRVDDLLTNK
jgi:hypothetical protein